MGAEKEIGTEIGVTSLPFGELLNEIIEATRRFGRGARQLDDMTALLIKRMELA